MDERVVAALRCPGRHDGEASLEAREATLRCRDGHAFDLARQGYVNLLAGRDPGTGDGPDLVAARAEVLAAGRFTRVTAALADVVAAHAGHGEVVVDVGAGTGEHLAGIVERSPDRVGIAVDLSKHAARRAARVHPRVGSVVADVWHQLPVRTGVAAAVTCVFAPRNGSEIRRVLAPDGALVVGTPMPHHLAELVGPLGLLEVDPRKEERLLATLDPGFTEAGVVHRIETRWRLSREEARTVVAMGPSADHLEADELTARVATLPERIAVRSAVELRVFRPR